MNELDILREARKLITPEEAWYQGALAGDGTSRRRSFHSGDNLDANDPTAKCWCAGGAILKVADLKNFTDPGFVNDMGDADATPSPARKAYERLCDLIPPMDEGGHRVTSYNDSPSTSHEDVLDLFDRAIAAAEAA